MIRSLITITVVTALALFGAARARADAGVPAPCPPEIQVGVRAALPASNILVCRVQKTPAQRFDGNKVQAGKITGYEVDVILADRRQATLELDPKGAVRSMVYAHSDVTGSSGKGMALLFWLFAAASVAGAVFVVTRRNLIAAVMGMVGSFIGIAAIYMMLYAQFLAVIQMLVYAGAIMVLFVFVVMILNRPEDEPVAPTGRLGQALGSSAILYLVYRLVMILVQVRPPSAALAAAAPAPTPDGYDWGSVRAVGVDLLGAGLFPFEAISILLLLAVVGAIAIARPTHAEDDAPAKARADGGVA
jgi:NADH-quinone oxidoreductase subunit J